jgi:hypothetical protein
MTENNPFLIRDEKNEQPEFKDSDSLLIEGLTSKGINLE